MTRGTEWTVGYEDGLQGRERIRERSTDDQAAYDEGLEQGVAERSDDLT